MRILKKGYSQDLEKQTAGDHVYVGHVEFIDVNFAQGGDRHALRAPLSL